MIQDRIRAQNHRILQRGHNLLHILTVQLQHPIQNRNLIVPEWFLSRTMELQERLEFGFLVGVRFVLAKEQVEELGYGPGDRREEVHHAKDERRAPRADGESVPDAESLRDDPEVLLEVSKRKR